MKKLLLTVAVIGAVVTGYSQGLISTGNSGNLISLKPLTSSATVLPGSSTAGTYTFVLLAAPSTTTGFIPFGTGTTLADWNATKASLSGYLLEASGVQHATSAGRVIFNPATAVLADFAPGASVNLVMVGWKGTATWADILAKGPTSEWIGTSKLATQNLGGGSLPLPSFFGGDAAQATGFTINQVIVPEPTSFALLGLGAAGLLIFRRRN